MLRECLYEIASKFAEQREMPLKDNAFAIFVRDEGKRAISSVVGDDNLIYKTSVGAGNWAEIPWLGIFNPESTQSATSGIYVVYLFSADLRKIYLCQAQGVTQIKKEFGKNQINELLRRSAFIRDRVPEYRSRILEGPIELDGTTNLAKEYDSAVAYYAEYDAERLPDETNLVGDLLHIVRLYGLLISRGGVDNLETYANFAEYAEDDNADLIEQRRYIRHQRIERNAKAAKLAKSKLGYTCQGCGIKFSNIYGEVGEHFIEAHHLLPLHMLEEGRSIRVDVETDFAVLCSNCHRMVHRHKPMLTIEQLQNLKGVKMLRRAFERKYGS